MSALEALSLIERIIGIALLLETLELFLMRPLMSETGIWRWSLLKEEFQVFPGAIRKLFDFFLRPPSFLLVLLLRGACASLLLIYPHPITALLALFATVLLCLRWRGTIHGGSDFMTLIVLMGLCAALVLPENAKLVEGSLWYIALQTCTSYFLAGLVKVKKQNWRTGQALRGFLSATIYGPFSLGAFSKPASWCVMLFELSFPLALLNSTLCSIYLGAALVFHLANAYVLGLNRFVFAWAAAYPALYYCSLRISSLNS